MQVTSQNGLIVAALFAALADARYTMRTYGAIRKASGVELAEQMTDAVIADTAAQAGLRILRRIRDDAALVERPVTSEEALVISAKAKAVVEGTEQPFELTYGDPAEELGQSEHSVGEDLSGDEDEDEDEQHS